MEHGGSFYMHTSSYSFSLPFHFPTSFVNLSVPHTSSKNFFATIQFQHQIKSHELIRI
jgi:hypothetical protein